MVETFRSNPERLEVKVELLDASRSQEEIEPDPNSLVYFTSTWYPDAKPGQDPSTVEMATIRRQLALESLAKAKDAGHQVVVVDEGSGNEFLQGVRAMGIETSLQKEKGMGAGRRQALTEASQREGAEFLFWVEPEKDSYVDFMQQMGAEMAARGADIGMPTRDLVLFDATYPDYQVASERRAAQLIDNALHQYGITSPDENFDWFFGPKVIRNRPELLELFTRVYKIKGDAQITGVRAYVNPEKYANVLFYPIFEALVDPRFTVVALDPITFKYPAEQKANETSFTDENDRKFHISRRKTQFYGILDELVHFARYKSWDRTVREKTIFERMK